MVLIPGHELMDEAAMSRALIRISHEIVERNGGLENVAIIGIQKRGVPLAMRIRKLLEEIEGVKVPMGILDITFYRDDLSMLSAHPVVNGTDIPFDVTGKKIILVDDVLFTGRTTRAAIENIFDMGRPDSIQLAILIDRGHRQLPFRADYVGKNVPTSITEHIDVEVTEVDGKDRVILLKEEENA
jgi:pyrimidine operon attenuation protein/uracil phosphoribosyltransferase